MMSCGGGRMVGWSLQGFPPSLSPEWDRQKPAPHEHPKLNLRGLHRCDCQRKAIWLAAATVTFTLWCSTLSSLPLGFGIWFKLSSSPLQVFFFFVSWVGCGSVFDEKNEFFQLFSFCTSRRRHSFIMDSWQEASLFWAVLFSDASPIDKNMLFDVHPKKDFHRKYLLQLRGLRGSLGFC